MADLKPIASEAGLITYRLKIEAKWALLLADEVFAPTYRLSVAGRKALQAVAKEASENLVTQVKEIEKTTNHDVKAVEYALQKTLTAAGAPVTDLPLIHFGCTSEDINNLAYALMQKDLRAKVLKPKLEAVIDQLAEMAGALATVPILSRTHGQPASPSTLGKEVAVFAYRLSRQFEQLSRQPILGKMNGAVGNYNAHRFSFPAVDWPALTKRFIEDELGLTFNPWTTQIESHDALAEYANILTRIATIGTSLARDMWLYISNGLFKQKVLADEVGSSTMPHKVNPIDFENAEGNFGLGTALLTHFAQKLPISRLQRDLSDSTVLRNLGVAVGHVALGLAMLRRGLGKVAADPDSAAAELNQAFEVLAEPIQTELRRLGVADAYERLKAATRGKQIDEKSYAELARACLKDAPAAVATRLADLTPGAYLGDAARLAADIGKHWQKVKENCHD
jgi:adenylosuccinate lyase